MIVPLARKIDGKKYLWDGVNYESREAAEQAQAAYAADGFEVELLKAEGGFLLYSRRLTALQSSG